MVTGGTLVAFRWAAGPGGDPFPSKGFARRNIRWWSSSESSAPGRAAPAAAIAPTFPAVPSAESARSAKATMGAFRGGPRDWPNNPSTAARLLASSGRASPAPPPPSSTANELLERGARASSLSSLSAPATPKTDLERLGGWWCSGPGDTEWATMLSHGTPPSMASRPGGGRRGARNTRLLPGSEPCARLLLRWPWSVLCGCPPAGRRLCIG
mmetsp:Transcript_48261/g.154542  ORF Transcript_48261/g.154542 Transcript_48261/m.154542 type:complete len:212 (-) Transcript_48261:598-1233(-)